MVVNTTEERSRRIAADVLDEQVTSTWVLIEEVGDVVDEAGDDDQRTLDRLFLDCGYSRQSRFRVNYMATYNSPS